MQRMAGLFAFLALVATTVHFTADQVSADHGCQLARRLGVRWSHGYHWRTPGHDSSYYNPWGGYQGGGIYQQNVPMNYHGNTYQNQGNNYQQGGIYHRSGAYRPTMPPNGNSINQTNGRFSYPQQQNNQSQANHRGSNQTGPNNIQASFQQTLGTFHAARSGQPNQGANRQASGFGFPTGNR